MSTNIKLKRSSVQGKIPGTADLDLGEVAINTYDGKLFIKKDDGAESIIEVGAGSSSAGDPNVYVDTFVGNGTNTDFTLSFNPIDDQYAFITINGVRQDITEYSITGNTVSFTEAPANNDIIESRVIDVITASVSVRDYETFIYTANNDTTFSGLDDNNKTLEYDVGKVEVYVNGVRLVDDLDYTADDETSVVISETVSGTVEIVSLSRASLLDSQISTNDVTLTSDTANQVVDTFPTGVYRSGKYLVQMTEGTNYHVTEVTVIHDDINTYITQYGTVFTNTSLGTIDSDISSGSVRLLVSPVSANTEIKTSRISLSV